MHVRDVGLASAADRAVWDHAAEHDLVIVSKDSDFHQLSFAVGPPPKVVWIRTGNCSTDRILVLLRKHAPDIEGLVAGDGSFLAIG